MGARQHHSARSSIKSLTAFGRAVAGEDVTPLCRRLIKRIRNNRNVTQAGSYLLGDSEGYIYILSETCVDAVYVLDRLAKMQIGLYLNPSLDDLRDDLLQHFVDVGYVTELDIYAAVREVEG